jgi:hypothetical protein
MQDNVSSLVEACSQGHLETVRILCERGGEELIMLTSLVTSSTCFFVFLSDLVFPDFYLSACLIVSVCLSDLLSLSLSLSVTIFDSL